jgi:hypothetical protein
MDRNGIQRLKEMKELVDSHQLSQEAFIEMARALIADNNTQHIEMDDSSDANVLDTDFPEEIMEILNNAQAQEDPASHDSIDRQSLSVQLKQIDGSRPTIRDEKITHTGNGGLHSDVEQAIVISCEGKKIEVSAAEGVCEATGKLAQKALSCHLCHRSICLRHCEFIEHDGENYPYCSSPLPEAGTSCARQVLLSMDTWREADRKKKGQA